MFWLFAVTAVTWSYVWWVLGRAYEAARVRPDELDGLLTYAAHSAVPHNPDPHSP